MVFKTKYNVIFVADEATVTFIEEFFFFFTVVPTPYGSSWARDQIGAVAASLCHSHSLCHSRSLQQLRIVNPLSEAKELTRILTDTMSGS